MTQDELNTITGLMTGMQTAIVHLANLLASQANISREELAASFEATADSVPAEARNAPLIQLPLRQVALGIRNSAAMGPEWEAWFSRFLH